MSDVINQIVKRDGSIVDFQLQKISTAIFNAMEAENHGTRIQNQSDALSLAGKADKILKRRLKKHLKKDKNFIFNVEEVQDVIEETLMISDLFKVAKAYILYREHKNLERKRNIFKKRINLKPQEYPELYDYVEAIRASYWVHKEFNYSSDVQDFKVHTTPEERQVIENAMLAIAQIEVSVKTFWGDIYKRLPKPEIGAVGYTFAESEVRHQDAYSHLLEILGLNTGFERVIEIPAIKDRIKYLTLHTEFTTTSEDRDFTKAILLFSLFIEHVSLFSQFLIIMSFNKHRNIFKGISNAIEATSKEEELHGRFGIELINLIREENPNWFDEDLEKEIYEACELAWTSEEKVIEWIYEKGDLDFIPKQQVKEFVKDRLNNSLESIGYKRILPVDEESLKNTDWFNEEVVTTKHGDFFVKRSTNYNKRSKSVTADDLF